MKDINHIHVTLVVNVLVSQVTRIGIHLFILEIKHIHLTLVVNGLVSQVT